MKKKRALLEASSVMVGVLIGILVALSILGLVKAVGVPRAEAADEVQVVVTLRDRPSLDALGVGARPRRLHRVVTGLRDHALASQRPVLAALEPALRQGRAHLGRRLWISNSFVVTAAPDVVAALRRRPDVASVVPDAIELVPEAASGNQVAVRAPEAWASGQDGTGVTVATLDSGVDPTDPDLAASWRGGAGGWFDPYGQHVVGPTDLDGHGTGVTGVMVGGGSSGTAIGTAPGARWIAARVFNDAGGASVSAVHAAFQWALDPDGNPATADAPQVVDASWSIGSAPGCDQTFRPDVQALRAAGILPVFPAGNFGPGVSTSVSPANYPESLSVGGVDATGAVMGTSSRGPSDCAGRARPFPDVVAPGKDVLTADRYGFQQVLQGTSVAAPHAAGLLALLLGESPGLSADQQWQLITSTSRDLGAAGPDEATGHGLVDAVALLAAAPPAPAPDFTVAATSTSTAQAGATAAWDATLSPTHGFAAEVSLSAVAPAALGSVTVSPSLVAGGSGTAQVTVSTSSSTAPGTYPVTVTATAGALTHSAVTDVTVTAPPPPPPPPPPPAPPALLFSTRGNVALPGVSGTADDADVYRWNGTAYARAFDATYRGLPAGANVDGLDVVDATHLYLSFATDTVVPGLGTVQDEDVVAYAAGRWSVWFNGTAHGLTAAGADIDAISVNGTTLSFSTVGDVTPPGVSGTADNADVYTWNGTRFARAWDASAARVPATANLDGLVAAGSGHLWASFADDVVLPGLGAVQDEDVVELRNGSWSVWFDGTAHRLTASGADLDAFDLSG